jgi:hypothetical protein
MPKTRKRGVDEQWHTGRGIPLPCAADFRWRFSFPGAMQPINQPATSTNQTNGGKNTAGTSDRVRIQVEGTTLDVTAWRSKRQSAKKTSLNEEFAVLRHSAFHSSINSIIRSIPSTVLVRFML